MALHGACRHRPAREFTALRCLRVTSTSRLGDVPPRACRHPCCSPWIRKCRSLEAGGLGPVRMCAGALPHSQGRRSLSTARTAKGVSCHMHSLPMTLWPLPKTGLLIHSVIPSERGIAFSFNKKQISSALRPRNDTSFLNAISQSLPFSTACDSESRFASGCKLAFLLPAAVDAALEHVGSLGGPASRPSIRCLLVWLRTCCVEIDLRDIAFGNHRNPWAFHRRKANSHAFCGRTGRLRELPPGTSRDSSRASASADGAEVAAADDNVAAGTFHHPAVGLVHTTWSAPAGFR